MRLNRLVLAVLAGFIVLMAVNTVFYPMVFPDGPPDKLWNQRTAPLVPLQVAATLITAALMAWMYPIGYRGKKPPWTEGLRFGLLLGAFLAVPMAMHTFARADIAPGLLLTPVLWTLVTFGITGIAIALVYGQTLVKTTE